MSCESTEEKALRTRLKTSIKMRILICCESSGTVRNAFRALGHDAWSCDLLPADDSSPYHIQGDCLEQLDNGWDMFGFHPPCTFLCVSGIHWNNRGRGWEQTEQALAFVRKLMARPEPWYLENPVSIISSRIRKPDQIIQPYQFGEDASKKTCLWLNRLPLLTPTHRIQGRLVNGVERWSNQTDSGQNKLAPSPTRWKERSKTYAGIAQAMATQFPGKVGRAQQPGRARCQRKQEDDFLSLAETTRGLFRRAHDFDTNT